MTPSQEVADRMLLLSKMLLMSERDLVFDELRLESNVFSASRSRGTGLTWDILWACAERLRAKWTVRPQWFLWGEGDPFERPPRVGQAAAGEPERVSVGPGKKRPGRPHRRTHSAP